jgi:hypothetical protein
MLSSRLSDISGCAAMMRESTRIPYMIATCALLAGVVLGGCVDRPQTHSAPAQAVPPLTPAPAPAASNAPSAATPPAGSATPAAPATPAGPATPSTSAPPTASAPKGSAAPKPTAPPASKGQPATPPKTASAPPKPPASATSPAPNNTPAAPPAASTAAAPKPASQPPAAPALDLTSLEQRLRETKAIGVFTKLSLKNQVDDLLGQFRAFHKQQSSVALPSLRQKYDLLLLKVLSLLQDGDPPLAAAISSSREAIWGILTDPVKFAKI